MKKNNLFYISIIVLSLLFNSVYALPYIKPRNDKDSSNNGNKSLAAGCPQPAKKTYLELNNVRALIHTGGDMWSENFDARYEIPKNSGKHALYAGAVWIGGEDINGQLKVAAVTYRQEGTDYYTGPLKTEIAGEEQSNVDDEICIEFDRHFVVTRDEVQKYRGWFNSENQAAEYPDYTVPQIITDWPAHGPLGGYDYNLAPFKDVDEDGVYNPGSGDYPYFDLDGELPCGTTSDTRVPRLYGDISMWWVYNDKGNIHGETKGDAVGMEIRAQAFAFATNDELNNMTFYNYALLNRSTYTIYNTYFGVWTDADLGFSDDDYVGCDVNRGLGYLYNGDPNDEPNPPGHPVTYGANPPAIGIDFFEGPYQDLDGKDNLSSWDKDGVLHCDKGFGKDSYDYDKDSIYLKVNTPIYNNGNINGLNFGDGIVDNERWGMRRFIYFNREGSDPNMLDPDIAIEYYNYLRGMWKNGQLLKYGGNGYSGNGVTEITTDFMFPSDSDPCGWGQVPRNSNDEENLAETAVGIVQEPWDETTVGNQVGDRRFVQSAGPFTLEPGAVNDITVGAVWARAEAANNLFSSVKEVFVADDKAQKLFENCFKVVDGPHAPEMDVVELDQKLIFHLYNKPISNNYMESYIEEDPFIVCPLDENENPTDCDIFYRFQGYIVYQLKDGTVSSGDLENPDLARIVYKCDLKDDVDSSIVNYYWDNELRATVPDMKVEITANDNKGIEHSFMISEDKFADDNTALVNNKEYYYMAIAYAFNEFKKYDGNNPDLLDGQKRPFLAGRKGAEGAIKRYKVIPHKTEPENGGTIVNTEYGQTLPITRLEGMGNGGNELILTDESHDRIMSGYPWSIEEINYEGEGAPIAVEIIDPLNLVSADFILKVDSIDAFEGNTTASAHYGVIRDSKWALYVDTDKNGVADTVYYSDQWISYGGYKMIPELGIAVKMKQVGFALSFGQLNQVGDINSTNGLISSSITISDTENPWLDFIPDVDGNNPQNWIKSGTVKDDLNKYANDVQGDWDDEGQDYESILGGTWAPYVLTAGKYWDGRTRDSEGEPLLRHYGPFADIAVSNSYTDPIKMSAYSNLASVDIYITSDKSKWTRSPVVEMCDLPELAIGGAEKFELRRSPSIDKNGNVDTINTTRKYGMGWFPGYAIDKESGCRLNIIYGEDSNLPGENGTDMIFNPTSNTYTPLGEILYGGKHYIYVMGQNIIGKDEYEYPMDKIVFSYYDEGANLYDNFLKPGSEDDDKNLLAKAYSVANWVALPLLNEGYEPLSSDYKISIDVEKPYRKGMKQIEVENPKNNNFPMYSFTTDGFAPVKADKEVAKEALDLIRVVPNPYYGHSPYYEATPIDYKVKITNLPPNCKVTIFSVNGSIIRNWNKADNSTYIEWDLENNNGLLIASGIYIVHVEVDGVGEKVIKWMGAMRPVDFGGF